MARGGYADSAAIHLGVPAADARHDFAPLHTDPRLGHHGDRRLARLRVHNHLDRPVPLHQFDCAQDEARLSRTDLRAELMVPKMRGRTVPSTESPTSVNRIRLIFLFNRNVLLALSILLNLPLYIFKSTFYTLQLYIVFFLYITNKILRKARNHITHRSI